MSGGVLHTKKMGTLQGYGDVWYHPEALTNIISFAKARGNGYKVNYDDLKDKFNIQNNNSNITFRRQENLYVTSLKDVTNKMDKRHGIQLLNTIAELKSHYTKKEYDNALKAQETYQKLGYPSIQDFKDLIKSGMIKNCPVNIKDIMLEKLVIYTRKQKNYISFIYTLHPFMHQEYDYVTILCDVKSY